MAKIRKMTPEERARQEANQRRLEQLIERKFPEEKERPREQRQPPAERP
jgi:hypothetical protein